MGWTQKLETAGEGSAIPKEQCRNVHIAFRDLVRGARERSDGYSQNNENVEMLFFFPVVERRGRATTENLSPPLPSFLPQPRSGIHLSGDAYRMGTPQHK